MLIHGTHYIDRMMMTHVDSFLQYRPTLFALAYRMLGSASEAEDVLQDAYLRYTGTPMDEIQVHEAYLRTIVTRLCLDHLKSARTQREQYLGPWLPEPLLTNHGESDPQHRSETRESITMAFLILLEALTPQERAVFLLHEVFAYEHAEVAEILHLNPAQCRQLFHRAKGRLVRDRPRFEASAARQQQLVEGFLAATLQGDIERLTHLLAEDVTFWADTGGKAKAPPRPVHGRDVIAKLMPIFASHSLQAVEGDERSIRSIVAEVNGETAVIVWIHDVLDSVLVVSTAGEQITALRLVRNPEKLDYIQQQLNSVRAG
jgi:RNA polymerase sigma-70 factor (ECF subfamily)